MAKKTKTSKKTVDVITTDERLVKFFDDHYPCKSCAEQCAGHGGGSAAMGGGCLCNDGVLLECLIG